MADDKYDHCLDNVILPQNVMEKIKLNCLKLWAPLIATAMQQNRIKQTQCNLTYCT